MPAADTIVAFAPKVIFPEYVLLPVVNRIAPPDETPVPEILIGSATVMPPEILNAAPEATVVVPLVAPRPLALVIANVPALILVLPV